MFAVLPFTTAGKNYITLVFVFQLTGVKHFFFRTPRKGNEKLNRRAKRMSALNMKTRVEKKERERKRECICVYVCVCMMSKWMLNEGFRSFEYTTHSEKLRYFLPEIFTGCREIRMRCGTIVTEKDTKDIFKNAKVYLKLILYFRSKYLGSAAILLMNSQLLSGTMYLQD